MTITRRMKRAAATLGLACVIACVLLPIGVLADNWYGQFYVDSHGWADVHVRQCDNCNAQPSPFPISNPSYARIADKSNQTAVSVDSGYQGNSIDNRNFMATESMLFAFNNNGSIQHLNAAPNSNTLEVLPGGHKLFSVNATTCTQIPNGVILFELWAAGTETATLTIYTDSGCTTKVWSGVPPSNPLTFNATNNGNNMYYKFSATPAATDWMTTN